MGAFQRLLKFPSSEGANFSPSKPSTASGKATKRPERSTTQCCASTSRDWHCERQPVIPSWCKYRLLYARQPSRVTSRRATFSSSAVRQPTLCRCISKPAASSLSGLCKSIPQPGRFRSGQPLVPLGAPDLQSLEMAFGDPSMGTKSTMTQRQLLITSLGVQGCVQDDPPCEGRPKDRTCMMCVYRHRFRPSQITAGASCDACPRLRPRPAVDLRAIQRFLNSTAEGKRTGR